jgi:catechol 2,3-dioxygenase
LADGALQFSDPAGMAVSIRVGERTAATAVAPFVNQGGTLGGRTAPMRSEAPRVRPNRLSHLAMFTRDIDTVIGFYQSALGLGLSDRSADIVAFMHGVHGSDHHMLALLNSTGPGLHHTSWEVSSINEIGLGADHMAQAGHAIQWGLGRHVLGSNYFTYVRDPWGSWAEYSAGIDYVPVDMEYRWADHAPEDSFFLWGPPPPPVFTDNVEQGA